MEESKVGYREILKQKEYMKTIIADIINRFGDSIDTIAFTWLVYQLTQSAAWSAIIFGVNRIPTVFLQPFAGAAIEGKNKKMIMVITDIIRGLCVGFIATALLFGFVNQWILLGTTIVISSAEAFRGPASSALIPKLLDKKYYDFGISLSRSSTCVVELVGLGAAGAIIAASSVSVAIYIDMATFFLSAFILFTLKVKEGELVKAKIDTKEYFETLKAGFSYVKSNSFLRYFVIFGVFLNAVLVPINSLQAPLVNEVLHSTEVMLSVFGMAITVGMLVGAAAYPYISKKISSHVMLKFGGYSIAVFYLSFVVEGRFITSDILMYVSVAAFSCLVGAGVSILSSFVSVEFIKNVEPEYMARTSAIFNAIGVAAMPVVSFILSAITGFVSTSTIFIIAGVLDILICLRLCSKKRFVIMKNSSTESVTNVVMEGIVNGKEIEDSSAC